MNRRKKFFLWVGVLFSCLSVCRQADAQHKASHKAGEMNIQLKAIAGLRYDVVRFQVKPGAAVKLTLANTDDMDHNLVFTRPGSRQAVINAALQLGANGPDAHYVPGSSDVLWHIATVSPGNSRTISFTAPNGKGIYPYVCTFPGHGNTMYGVMYVTDKKLPPLNEDPNIPPAGKPGMSDHMHATERKQLHPYEIVTPYLIRTFMPNSGPAAIAVSLPDSLSYCWDAGSCSLRYAWSGAFLNVADLWQRKGDEVSEIAGSVFFRDKTNFPFLIGDKAGNPGVQFKGYRLIDRYPEFHFQMNGIDVYELIKPRPGGSGLVCYFRIPESTETVWFVKSYSGNVIISASAGRWDGNRLRLSPVEANHFTLTITKKEGGSL